MSRKLRNGLALNLIGLGLLIAGGHATSASGQTGGPAGGPAAGPSGASPTGGTGISGGSSAIGGVGPSGGGVVTGPGATGNPLNYGQGAMPGMGTFPGQAPSGQFPQPSSPFGSGRRLPLGPSSRAGSGSGTIGRGKGAVPPGGEANPAQTLLDDMNGSNNGRRSGHAALRPPAKYERAPLSSDPFSRTPDRVEERAVFFKRRGAYEDAIYRPRGGSYQRQTGRRVGSADRSVAVPRVLR